MVDYTLVIIGAVLLALAAGFFLALRSVNKMDDDLEEIPVSEKTTNGIVLSIE